jgi:hypothetical protein
MPLPPPPTLTLLTGIMAGIDAVETPGLAGDVLFDAPLLWYTLSELTDQYASTKAEGLFWTKSWHVEALELHVASVLQTLPAQSPQNVVSKTIWWSSKNWSMSQPPENDDRGVPQLLGSGLPEDMSDGMLERGKNQMVMAELVHSVAYTPP